MGGPFSERYIRDTSFPKLVMKILIGLLLLFGLATEVSAQSYPFKESGLFSPYGDLSREQRDVFRRAQSEPEALQEIANRPLEETYELLRTAMSSNRVETVKAAEDILYKHPDFEPFLHRTVARMIDALLKGPGNDWKSVQRLESDVSGPRIALFMSFFRRLPPEMRVRLYGPCLRGPAYQHDNGDVIDFGPANIAAIDLKEAVRKITGEVLTETKDRFSVDLVAAREWWAKNEAKYGWVPPEPRPPSEPKPIPPRVPLTQGANSKPAATAKDAPIHQRTEGPTSTATGTSLWITGIAILLAAAGVWWSARKRK